MTSTRTRIFSQVILRTFVLSFVLALVGCNTVEGVGKDVKATGQTIEKAADRNKTY